MCKSELQVEVVSCVPGSTSEFTAEYKGKCYSLQADRVTLIC